MCNNIFLLFLFIKPARRREERRQRPQRHTTVVSPSDHTEAVASLVKGESTGGLNRTLHPHLSISRWNSVNKIRAGGTSTTTGGDSRRGSIKAFFSKEGSEASEATPLCSEATPTAPSTPVHFFEDEKRHQQTQHHVHQQTLNGLLPSPASVIRALSPMLTPAFMAANNMAQKAHRMSRHPVETMTPKVPVQESAQKLGPRELPMMTQVSRHNFNKKFKLLSTIDFHLIKMHF